MIIDIRNMPFRLKYVEQDDDYTLVISKSNTVVIVYADAGNMNPDFGVTPSSLSTVEQFLNEWDSIII